MKPLWVTFLLLVLLVLITFAAVAFAPRVWSEIATTTSGLEPGTAAMSPAVETVILSLAMLLGIVFGHLYTQLGQAPAGEPVDLADELKRLGSNRDFWRALIASPIVFLVVYLLARDEQSFILALVFAFENGFFSHAVLRRRQTEFEG